MRCLKVILPVWFVFASFFLKAQDFPYHYFSLFNPMINNPAFAAFDSDMRADAGTYNLWAGGFKPLNEYQVSFSMSPDFRKRRRRTGYDTRIGIGGVLLKENTGPFAHNIYQLVYAYHIPLNESAVLSLGISGLVETMTIDVNSLTAAQPDDPRLMSGNNSSVLIDGGFGSAIHGENYVVSLSVLNLAAGEFHFKNSSAEEISNYRKFNVAAKYNFELNRNFHIQPVLAFRNTYTKNYSFDTSVGFNIKSFIIGFGYRKENSVFVFARIPYKEFFFTYHSENPVQSNHMIGNGHTFTFGWSFNSIR